MIINMFPNVYYLPYVLLGCSSVTNGSQTIEKMETILVLKFSL